MTETKEVIYIVKLEKCENQPQDQNKIGIENSEETFVKLEETENELPVKNVISGTDNILNIVPDPSSFTEGFEQIESVELFEDGQFKIENIIQGNVKQETISCQNQIP